ncbi:hypothetical protein H206_05308 [Candidatus Electrothrix aarhusensis]|uniref:Uncharacterized protein n=1 Tax=Candidatus Electrothrix aarhusensis TaxID=1859131 RepID=A0A3S3R1X9_9BACT|nr:hypothetical protein H206_05308 [Candidatus Electrothrix aarhusensis]
MCPVMPALHVVLKIFRGYIEIVRHFNKSFCASEPPFLYTPFSDRDEFYDRITLFGYHNFSVVGSLFN